MDGGGRLAGSLSETASSQPALAGPAKAVSRRRRAERRGSDGARGAEPAGWRRRFARWLDRVAERISRVPRHAGVAAAILIIAGSALYGAVRGGQGDKVVDFLKDVRDMGANAAGFNIATVALTGQKHLSREEILATAGVTGRASLLFFDVADARARLLTNPWIAEATVQKLLPDRLVITISEREAFALWQKAGRVDPISARWYLIAFHRRFALPTACLVLALVGIPLGLSSKKSGKSGGFVLTILLVFVYYVISLVGVSLARQGKVSPWFGAWLADFVFLALAIFLLLRAEKRPFEMASFRAVWKRDPSGAPANSRGRRENAFDRISTRRRMFSASFPTLLDDYVLRDFFVYLGMILSTFLVLVIVFTLFELLGDILKNQVPATVVAEYLLNVAPYLLYNVAPLVMLLAVLVTFGMMQRSNEITAIKATGTSIYRIVTPVIVAAGVLAVGLFFADQFYLPHTNKRQEALHNQIKGKPPQTYLRPDRSWIFGQNNDIYYYQFFDPDHDQFGNVTVFKLDRASFAITRRIHADRAHWAENLNRWVYEQGWDRALNVSAIANYRPFEVATFPDLPETPSYFKKEVKQYTEMNYEELRRYIGDLQQGGFDVVRLRVQLHKKLSYPLITLIMAVLAIPFSLSPGKKGAITGVAVAVGIAVFYTVVSRLFEAMGDLSQLPPALAAWSPDLIFVLVGGYLILKVPT